MQTEAQQKVETKTPLDDLSEMMAGHMTHVNDLIAQNMQSDVTLIPKLADYLIAAGGKRIRPLLTLASTALFEGPIEKSYSLAAAVEFIHTATLLHDDVVDESAERRGKKTANLVFGNQASVLVGDFLFSKSFQMMVEAKSLDVLRILSNASATIAQGEVLQLMTTNDIKTTMDSYLEVIESKTAALFAASCEVGAVLSEQDEKTVAAMRAYGMTLGTAFQIIDDALDYKADQSALGKEIGDDFREGKMTAPVIFALQNANEEEHAFWKRTLGHKKQTAQDFDQAMAYITKHNALKKTIVSAEDYAEKAKKHLEHIPISALKNILENLADFTVHRGF
ncbi:MAG: polyprenyl synthetase family protein [Alphaproteobacteria bacterium]|nr:polyprenyl synthetase family protein [Alphaproteobacteria bacterium]